jgi:hypothetical protein
VKLGRLPRAHNPRITLLGTLTEGKELPTPPAHVNYLYNMPNDSGMYYNDTLGDCTCAAVYHALQVWTANTGPAIDGEPENDALLLYEQTCGYVPGDPNTDQGGVEQRVLEYWHKTGVPVGNSGSAGRQNLAAFVEVDPGNHKNIRRAIYQCGVLYIGFNVPAYVMNGMTDANSTWWIDSTQDGTIVGGHAVIVAGYDENVLKFISWGNKYQMTWEFFETYCDEAYALANADWFNTSGHTLAGLTLAELEQLMTHL